MPCFSRVRAALRATLANSSWRECMGEELRFKPEQIMNGLVELPVSW
jgi:hypothetical protein